MFAAELTSQIRGCITFIYDDSLFFALFYVDVHVEQRNINVFSSFIVGVSHDKALRKHHLILVVLFLNVKVRSTGHSIVF